MSRRPNFDDYVEPERGFMDQRPGIHPETFAEWSDVWRMRRQAREHRMNALLAFLTVIGMAVGLWVVIGLIGWALLM